MYGWGLSGLLVDACAFRVLLLLILGLCGVYVIGVRIFLRVVFLVVD